MRLCSSYWQHSVLQTYDKSILYHFIAETAISTMFWQAIQGYHKILHQLAYFLPALIKFGSLKNYIPFLYKMQLNFSTITSCFPWNKKIHFFQVSSALLTQPWCLTKFLNAQTISAISLDLQSSVASVVVLDMTLWYDSFHGYLLSENPGLVTMCYYPQNSICWNSSCA